MCLPADDEVPLPLGRVKPLLGTNSLGAARPSCCPSNRCDRCGGCIAVSLCLGLKSAIFLAADKACEAHTSHQQLPSGWPASLGYASKRCV